MEKRSSLPTEQAVASPRPVPGVAPEPGLLPSGPPPAPPPVPPPEVQDGPVTPRSQQRSRLQIVIIMSCLSASVFIAALDITIIGTALPTIAGHFGSEAGYTWAGSSFILAHTTSTPNWGKVSDIWGRKPVLLLAALVFFVGSLACALADSMGSFIAGRAIQGVGAAGLQTLVNICVSDLFSLRDRGLYFGLISVVWACASGVGPVLGGIFTQELTWRWCFYINLPITGVVFFFLLFTLHLDTPRAPLWRGLKAIDWSGNLLVIGGTLMFLLGLTFGGVIHPWDSPIVLCLVVSGVVVWALFVFNEWKLAHHPVIPPRLFRGRTALASFAVCFCHGYVFMGVAWYLPFYFQAVLGATPLLSGVYLLPFVLSITFTSALAGLYIQRTGRYILTAYIGLPVMVLGVGLMIDLDVGANWTKLILFQVIAGIGIGLNFEGPLLALQTTMPVQDVATATATFGFIRAMSTAVSGVVGAVVFQNQMSREGPAIVAALGPDAAAELGGNEAMANLSLIDSLPPEQKAIVREALYRSLRTMWIMYVAFAALAWVAGLFIGVHPLSKDHEVVVLGLVNEKDGHSGGNEARRQTRAPGNDPDSGTATSRGIQSL
ncbi:Efflux pump antibiotic resistance [Pleurostoma richardsiae]|uniref:Efflux pump dotC n=1 Tax=Pleurostoma richardsiae TaxID=41990 RepID=A0AA38VH08_9PEZI|nr:Efflux pump antibiotic resistance [Pleurostoma richardsiae]